MKFFKILSFTFVELYPTSMSEEKLIEFINKNKFFHYGIVFYPFQTTLREIIPFPSYCK